MPDEADKPLQKRTRRRAVEPSTPGPSSVRGLAAPAALGLVAVVGGIALFALTAGADDPPPPARATGPTDGLGIQRGPAPWVAEQELLPARLARIGIPFSNMEGTALHIHPRLEVYVNGTEVTVPTDIGISYSEQAMAALHTHDTEGRIHVESPVIRNYSLGQFFDTWGVRLTRNCIGGHCSTGARRLRAFVDGAPVADPRAVTLADDQDVVVAFGTSGEIQAARG
jgi:hypothetical protein